MIATGSTGVPTGRYSVQGAPPPALSHNHTAKLAFTAVDLGSSGRMESDERPELRLNQGSATQAQAGEHNAIEYSVCLLNLDADCLLAVMERLDPAELIRFAATCSPIRAIFAASTKEAPLFRRLAGRMWGESACAEACTYGGDWRALCFDDNARSGVSSTVLNVRSHAPPPLPRHCHSSHPNEPLQLPTVPLFGRWYSSLCMSLGLQHLLLYFHFIAYPGIYPPVHRGILHSDIIVTSLAVLFSRTLVAGAGLRPSMARGRRGAVLCVPRPLGSFRIQVSGIRWIPLRAN